MAIAVECRTCRRKYRVDEKQRGSFLECRGCGLGVFVEGPQVREFDVFISHSQLDKAAANAICDELEMRGIACWIAPRNVRAGQTWASTIITAISECPVMIVLYSTHSNASQQVLREVERAVAKRVILLSIRLDDSTMTPEMEYYLSARHWMDALSKPFEAHLPHIAARVEELLPDANTPVASPASRSTGGRGAAAPAQNHDSAEIIAPWSREPGSARRGVRRLALAFVALVAVAAAVSGGAWWFATMPVATPTPAPEVSLADRIRWNESGAEAVLTLPGGTTMDFVKIGPGAFTMGSPFSEPGRDIDEKEHPVELTKAFWMAKHEVTQRQWMAVMDENPSRFEGDARPVDSVSWMDCQRFLSRLNKPGDIKFRLPTEAEWEYACRAGSNAAHHFGDGAAMNEYAWSGANGQNATHDVGQKKPNAWGLCDMYGNVWEWCADRYGLLSSGAATDPAGPNDGAFRVLRGGSWAEVKVSRLRSALRHRDDPDNRLDNYGFRCVRSL